VTYDETQALSDAIEHDGLRVFVSSARDEDAPAGEVRMLIEPPYVVLHPQNGPDDTDRVTGPATRRRPSWLLHCVGESSAAAEIVAGLVDARLRPRLRGIRVAVEGQNTKPIRRDDVGPVIEDDAVRPSVWFVPVTYSFESTPAQ
jgi:hypothetical protein